MKKSRIITAVVALLAVAAVPFLYAGPGHRFHRGMDGFGPFARLERAKNELLADGFVPHFADRALDAMRIGDLPDPNYKPGRR